MRHARKAEAENWCGLLDDDAAGCSIYELGSVTCGMCLIAIADLGGAATRRLAAIAVRAARAEGQG